MPRRSEYAARIRTVSPEGPYVRPEGPYVRVAFWYNSPSYQEDRSGTPALFCAFCTATGAIGLQVELIMRTKEGAHAIWLLGVPLLVLWTCQPPAEPQREGHSTAFRQLVRVTAGYRPMKPRLSGGFAYAPCRQVGANGECGGMPEPGSAAAQTIARASSRLMERTSRSRLKEPEQAIGHLLVDEGSHSLETALELLEQAVLQAPTPAVLSDLAAVYYQVARYKSRPEDLVRALSLAERAAQQAPKFPEALFNRALILETLSLHHQAMGAWQAYRQLDPASGWSNEAANHLAHLAADLDPELRWQRAKATLETTLLQGDPAARMQIVRWFRLAARDYLEQELLPLWATDVRERRLIASAQHLEVAAQLAAELHAQTGDGLWEEAIQMLGKDHGAALADVYWHYRAGLERYDAFDLEAATKHLQQARTAFARAGNPLRAWCDFHLAVCLFQQHQQSAALAILTRLGKEAEGKHYPSLEGRIHWVTGLCRFFLGRPLEALRDYEAARRAFKATGESEHLTSIAARLADILRLLGNHELAWQHREQALQGLAELRSPKRRHFVLGEAALAALDLDQPIAARFFQAEALRQAQISGTPLEISEALRALAAVHLRAGEPAAALDHLQQAASLAAGLAEPSLQQILNGKILELTGRLLLPKDPQQAAMTLSAALGSFQQTHYQAQLAAVYVERAAAYQALGNTAQATRDLEAALGTIEAEWQGILTGRRRGADEELWPAYFDDRQSVFDQLLGLLVAAGRNTLAFDYAEKARARDLLDLASNLPGAAQSRLNTERAVPLTAAQVLHLLPPSVALVEFALSEDQLLTFMLWKGQLTLIQAPVGRRQLAGWVAALTRGIALRVPEHALNELLARLHQWLIAPVLAQAPQLEQLVVIPDEVLHAVPFAALRDRARGRYLIEDYAIAVAPSASLFSRSLERDRELSGQPLAALVIGNPDFDRQLFPALAPLPGAAAEATAIAEIYSHSVLLTGPQATKGNFLQRAGEHAVVHLAAHALINQEKPFLSALALAPSVEDPSDGTLYAHELLLQSLPRTRLVVLSACSTAGGHPIGALGVSGLMRPFLGAGVPAVVGSLWPVHDRAAVHLLTRFHQHFAGGQDAAQALRRAQLDLLQAPDRALHPVWMWSPFILLGSATSPTVVPARSSPVMTSRRTP